MTQSSVCPIEEEGKTSVKMRIGLVCVHTDSLHDNLHQFPGAGEHCLNFLFQKLALPTLPTHPRVEHRPVSAPQLSPATWLGMSSLPLHAHSSCMVKAPVHDISELTKLAMTVIGVAGQKPVKQKGNGFGGRTTNTQ